MSSDVVREAAALIAEALRLDDFWTAQLVCDELVAYLDRGEARDQRRQLREQAGAHAVNH